MDATEGAVHFATLLEVVGEDDYRTRKWDELVAQLVSA